MAQLFRELWRDHHSNGAPPLASQPTAMRAALDALAHARQTTPWFDDFARETLVRGPIRLQLYIATHANAAAPVIVFMPGTNAYAMLYGQFLRALGQDAHILAFDPRGHGASTGHRGSYDMAELVSDFLAVVRLARERFTGPVLAAGSSQGGITAFYAAATADSGIDAGILHNLADLSSPDATCLVRAPRLASLGRPLLMAAARRWPELPVPMAAYLDLRREPVRGLGHAAGVIAADPVLPPYVRLRTLASLGTEPLPQPIEEIRTPLFVMQAEHDTIFPTAYIRGLCDRLPHGELHVYPGTAHYLVVDDVDQVVPDIRRWMSSVCAPTMATCNP